MRSVRLERMRLSMVLGWRVIVRTRSQVRPCMFRLLGEFSTSSVMGMYTCNDDACIAIDWCGVSKVNHATGSTAVGSTAVGTATTRKNSQAADKFEAHPRGALHRLG